MDEQPDQKQIINKVSQGTELGNFIRRIEYDLNTQVLNTKELAFNYIMANTDIKLESGGSL